MSKQSRKYLYQFIQATFGAGGDEAFDPFTYFGTRLVAAAWAPFEGPNTAPASVAAYKRTSGVAYGDRLDEISNYAGGDHYTRAASTGDGAILQDGGAGPDYFDSTISGTASYEQSTTPVVMGDDLSMANVWSRISLSQGGYMYQHGSFSPLFRLYTSSPYNIQLYHQLGNAVVPVGDLDWHVSTVHTDTENTKTDFRHDGAITSIAASIHDYGALTTMREFSGRTGSTRSRAKQVGWFKVRDLTTAEAELLETWIASETGVVLASGFSIASPQSYATYNRTSPDAGVVRGHGTYDADKITSMDVSLDGSTWTACTLSGGTWAGEATGVTGTHTFYVRGNGGVYASSVSNVKIGRVVAGMGQSNMLGSSLNKTNYSTTLQLGIYDPRPSPMGLMAGRSDRDTWGTAYDEGWIPDYLNNRYVADAIPWGFVRFAIGSTRIAFWEPTAAVDAAGFGYSVQYYAEFIRAVIASQGYDPNTYNPATDRQCVEEVYIQIGETDAKSSTTKASFKASLSAIAAQIKTDLGSGVIIRASVLQDLFTTGYVATEAQLTAIQEAVTETIANDANVSAGPDFSSYVLDTDPPEGSGNVHFYTDAQVDYCAGEWDAYPTT